MAVAGESNEDVQAVGATVRAETCLCGDGVNKDDSFFVDDEGEGDESFF